MDSRSTAVTESKQESSSNQSTVSNSINNSATNDSINEVRNILSDLERQLNDIFKGNQLNEDFTILNGYLTFLHSKLIKVVVDLLEVSSTSTDLNVIKLNHKLISFILDQLWGRIYYPVFKWFQNWRKWIITNYFKKVQPSQNANDQTRFIEFRKMNSKLNKFAKLVNQFYSSIIQTILKKFDTSLLLPKLFYKEINEIFPLSLYQSSPPSPSHFSSSSPSIAYDNTTTDMIILMMLQKCLFYLGHCQRYKAINEKIYDNYQIDDFKKALFYFNWSNLLLPSFGGESFLQLGLIHVHTKNFGIALQYFIRASLTRISNPIAMNNFQAIISNNNSKENNKNNNNNRLYENIIDIIKDTRVNEFKPTKIVNKEIIEYYFIVLFGINYNPSSWVDTKKNGTQFLKSTDINLKHLEASFLEKISTRFFKNMNLILQNLITAIGGFHLLLLNEKKNSKEQNIFNIGLEELSKHQLSYLDFVFKFISHLIKNVIMISWEEKPEDFQYIAMVRLILSWLNSNRCILQYSHTNELFTITLAKLSNQIIKNKSIKLDTSKLKQNSEFVPTRTYLFEEDVIFREFASIHFNLSGFNDSKINSSPDRNIRLMGFSPEVEDTNSENNDMDIIKLKLYSIILMSKKVLDGNQYGIKWDDDGIQFDHIPIVTEKNTLKYQGKKRGGILPNLLDKKTTMWKKNKQRDIQVSEKKKTLNGKELIQEEDEEIVYARNDNINEPISVSVLETQLLQGRHSGSSTPSDKWGYSGSSVPVPPSNFNVKPSEDLTQNITEQTFSSVFGSARFQNQPHKELSSSSVKSNSETSLPLRDLENSLKNMTMSDQNMINNNNNSTNESVSYLNTAAFQQQDSKIETTSSAPTSSHNPAYSYDYLNNLSNQSQFMSIPAPNLQLPPPTSQVQQTSPFFLSNQQFQQSGTISPYLTNQPSYPNFQQHSSSSYPWLNATTFENMPYLPQQAQMQASPFAYMTTQYPYDNSMYQKNNRHSKSATTKSATKKSDKKCKSTIKRQE
ncbi:Ebs1p NDAI_0C04780 [Naumovozyma dairenensis CBS 421]|uniref:DNA/RNA-binding domain-containing protein n=1 Tax=Naumovozyma dairenensis (strain ATCC 10597 / BCRC 20456 / CBS 421 / NBRC 0211 / NRRL Y-12639) TaxID=1071378 RepID=G0W8M6_NAUDC|nr:hypothetical protein NDAI_0C04780 [Naumovozyma dairenensis CBS 421]CCD24137.1 hypothetical protein NDAI_0C04780 [Naumovozyma dairenensis CBS 421]